MSPVFLLLCSFLDHLAVMFGEELPPWDTDRKYLPHNLQVGVLQEEYQFLFITKRSIFFKSLS